MFQNLKLYSYWRKSIFPPQDLDILNLMRRSNRVWISAVPFQGAQWLRRPHEPADRQPRLLHSGKGNTEPWRCCVSLRAVPQKAVAHLWEEMAFLTRAHVHLCARVGRTQLILITSPTGIGELAVDWQSCVQCFQRCDRAEFWKWKHHHSERHHEPQWHWVAVSFWALWRLPGMFSILLIFIQKGTINNFKIGLEWV